MEAKTISSQVFSENIRIQVSSLKILALKKLESLLSPNDYYVFRIYSSLSDDFEKIQAISNSYDKFSKNCLSNEAKSVNGQIIFETSERRIPSLKILTLRKLESLPSSSRSVYEILYSVFTGDYKKGQTYFGTSDESYRSFLTNEVKSVNGEVFFENDERRVPTLKILLNNLKKLPSSSNSSDFKNGQQHPKSFHESYKSCVPDKSKSVNVLFENNVRRVPSLKFLSLRKFECLPSSNEYAFRVLCSALTEYSKCAQTHSDSSDESYTTCLSDIEQLEELEPTVTLKSPERQIVMKQKDFLHHCDSVKSGSLGFKKNSRVLRRNCTTNKSKAKGTLEQNSKRRPEGGDIQISLDENSQENDNSFQGNRRNVRDLVRYFDSVFK